MKSRIASYTQTVCNDRLRRGGYRLPAHPADEPLLAYCAAGVEMAFVTLHVGAGLSSRCVWITSKDHIMRSEYAEVPQNVVDDAVLA